VLLWLAETPEGELVPWGALISSDSQPEQRGRGLWVRVLKHTGADFGTMDTVAREHLATTPGFAEVYRQLTEFGHRAGTAYAEFSTAGANIAGLRTYAVHLISPEGDIVHETGIDITKQGRVVDAGPALRSELRAAVMKNEEQRGRIWDS
jgi:hypothetical protein